MPFDVGNKTPKLLIFMRGQFPRTFFPSGLSLVYFFNANLTITGFYVLQYTGQARLSRHGSGMGHVPLKSSVI
jgi:hypothetical protein